MPCHIDVVHGVGEKVPGGCLDEVLGKLATVGFDRTPFPGGAIHPVEEDAGHTEAVLTEPGSRVAQLPPRRQSNEQAPGAVGQVDASDPSGGSGFGGGDGCLFDVVPELRAC